MLKLKNNIVGAGLGAVLALSVVGNSFADFDDAVKEYEVGDYSKAMHEWQQLAQKDDPAAMRNVGHMYRRGLGVDQDFTKALSWYKRAAEMGFDRAQANVASMYLRGQGVEQDYVKAASWFTKAARNGHKIAQYNLGLMYEHGKGVEKSGAKALAWYNLAAKAGHKQALNKVSLMVATDPDVKDENVIAPTQTQTAAVVEQPVVVAPEALKTKPSIAPKVISEPAPVVTTPVVAATAEKMIVAAPVEAPKPAAKKFDPFASSANNKNSSTIEQTGAPTAFNQVKTSETLTPTEMVTPTEVVAGPAKQPVIVEVKSAPEPMAEKTIIAEPQVVEKTQVSIVEPVAAQTTATVPKTQPAVAPEPEKKGFFESLKSLVLGDDEDDGDSKPVVAAVTVAAAPAGSATPAAPITAIPVPKPMAVVQSVHVAPGSGLSIDERLEMASLSFAVEEYQQALSVWAPLAQQGNSEAQFNLGQMFYEGYAVPVDRVKAFQWWSKAKANGSTVASSSLDKLAPSLTYLEKRRLQIAN